MSLSVCHRGLGFDGPENTLRAFRQSIDSGCGRIEIDVRLSRDGIPVVIHDETIDRVSNGSGTVAEMTAEQLQNVGLEEGENIPTLDDVVKLCKDKIALQVELKAEGTPQRV